MAMRLLGLDPGLRQTGWGVIETDGHALIHVASGAVRPPETDAIAARLAWLHDAISRVVADYAPQACAIEESFMNRNAASALKLGHARGVAMLAPAAAGLAVAEYPATVVKKSLVGNGQAAKEQVQAMVRMLLPGAAPASADAADALAVAICHAHHLATARRLALAAGPAA